LEVGERSTIYAFNQAELSLKKETPKVTGC
jgi:hypothetical protein